MKKRGAQYRSIVCGFSSVSFLGLSLDFLGLTLGL